MRKEIVVHAERELTHIAILENGRLAELYVENPQHERTIGNIYLGRIKKVMPSIKAAFVDVGLGQDAFLHYSDLTDNMPDWLDFLKDPNRTVGDLKPTTARPKGRRRRPSKQRPQGRRSEGQTGESLSDEDGKRGGRLGKNARARGERRQQQRQRGGRRQNGRDQQSQQGQREGRQPSEFLERDKSILVKITKEPISNKGSRVSTDISLAGRFLVLVPLADYVAVSKKISSYKERRRLKVLAKSLAPEGFGVIVRTVAEGKSVRMLDTDLRLLVEKWRRIEKRIQKAGKPPALAYEDVSMVSSIMRDLFSEDYDRILIDDQKLFRNLKNYVGAIAPEMQDAVQLYEGKSPIYRHVGVQRDLDEAFSTRVEMPSGGYLFIEHTEAMHVVDVNSGRTRHRGASQEENALKVNLEAARIIARQLRLRDLGGIIVVDFIDLRDERKRRKVYDELRREFRKDRAVTKLLPMSDFGLISITRQRIRPSITTTMDGLAEEETETTASTESRRGESGNQRQRDSGRGRQRSEKPSTPEPEAAKPQKPEEIVPKTPPPRSSRAPKELVEELDKWVASYRAAKRRGPIHLHVHPFTGAYLTSRVPNQPTRWLMRHFTRVRVKPTPTLDPLSYRFVDARSGEDLTHLFGPKLLKAAEADMEAEANRSESSPAEAALTVAESEVGEEQESSEQTSPKSSRSRRDAPQRRRDGGESERKEDEDGNPQRRNRRRGGRGRGRQRDERRGGEEGSSNRRRDEDIESSGRSRGERDGGSEAKEERPKRPSRQQNRSRSNASKEDSGAQAQSDARDAAGSESSEEKKPTTSRRSRSQSRSRGKQRRDEEQPSGEGSQAAQDSNAGENGKQEEPSKPKRGRSRSSRPAGDNESATKLDQGADAVEGRAGDEAEAKPSKEVAQKSEEAGDEKPQRPSRSRGRSRSSAKETKQEEPKASAPEEDRNESTKSAKPDEKKPESKPASPTVSKPVTSKPKPRIRGDKRFMVIDLTSRSGSVDPDADNS